MKLVEKLRLKRIVRKSDVGSANEYKDKRFIVYWGYKYVVVNKISNKVVAKGKDRNKYKRGNIRSSSKYDDEEFIGFGVYKSARGGAG